MGLTSKPLGGALALALVAMGAAAPASSPAQTVAPSPTNVVQLSTSRGRLVTLTTPMSDVFVANDAIADVQVRSATQLYVYGKSTGETTLYATSKSGKVVYSATVRVGNNIDSIGSMLSLAMPDAQIRATPMNGLVLLTGTVATPGDAAEAERLVAGFVGDGIKVLSRLKTATPLQVVLQVRIAEVSRSFAKNVGINLLSRDTTGGFMFGVASGRSPGTIGGTPPATSYSFTNNGAQRTSLGLAGHLLGLDILSAIDLGETTGQVTTLATPNLSALSGETANFLAGGEIPIPVSQGLGAVSVEYKQYGVSLSYTPTVLSDGRISLRVRPEVSQLSSAGAVTLNGVNIPALTTRRAETTVELGSGQSMMIAGLLSNTHDNSIDKAPFLGDLPIVGALFRSNSFKRNETELVIIVTPYLVKPVNAADIALPTDGYRAPTDADRILLGQIGSGTTGGRRPVPTMAPPATARPEFGAVAPPPLAATAPEPRPVADRRRAGKPLSAAPGFSSH